MSVLADQDAFKYENTRFLRVKDNYLKVEKIHFDSVKLGFPYNTGKTNLLKLIRTIKLHKLNQIYLKRTLLGDFIYQTH